jgi:hypothetical protein
MAISQINASSISATNPTAVVTDSSGNINVAGFLGLGTSGPTDKLHIVGGTVQQSSSDSVSRKNQKFGAVRGQSGVWITIFTSGNASAQACGFIDVSTIYATPSSICSLTKVMVRGAKTFSVVQQLGDAASGYSTMTFRWSGNDFQVQTSDPNIYYSIDATLHSPNWGGGYGWSHTWGTGW